MIKLIIIIILFVKSVHCQDTIEFKKDLTILNGTANVSPIFESISNYNYSFNGYLVFKINLDEVKQTDTTFFNCSVYWIDSLKDILDETNHFNYYTFLSLSFENKLFKVKEDSNGIEIRNFATFYTYFNRANEPECSTYLYEKTDVLRSKIFNNSIVWVYADRYFVIFKCSFNAMIMKVKMGRFINDGYDYFDWKLFIPISKLKSFDKINEEDPLKMGLEKSKIVFKTK